MSGSQQKPYETTAHAKQPTQAELDFNAAIAHYIATTRPAAEVASLLQKLIDNRIGYRFEAIIYLEEIAEPHILHARNLKDHLAKHPDDAAAREQANRVITLVHAAIAAAYVVATLFLVPIT